MSHRHASNRSEVSGGFPARKTLVSPGKEKQGFGHCVLCPHLCWSAGQGKRDPGFGLTIIRVMRSRGPVS